MTELRCHFGKYGPRPDEPEGGLISEIPSGYLRWACNKITNTRPAPEYRFHEDGTAMTEAEVDRLEDQMKDFLSAAADELTERDEA